MIITTERVKQNLSDVTTEMVGRAHKFFSIENGRSVAYYLVESKSQIDESTGYPVEYAVRWSKTKGFTCGCKSGEFGFSNVKHPSGVCEHVRIAVAAAQEERAAIAEISAQQAAQELAATQAPVLTVDGKPADAATIARVMTAEPKKSNAKANSPKPFSLMR